MQVHATVVPRNRLYPECGNQNGAVENPFSTFDFQVTDMPGSVVQNETFQTAEFTVRASNRAGLANSDRGISGSSVLPQPKMAGMRRADDQTTASEPHGGIQG
jgi:hypothetical protein